MSRPTLLLLAAALMLGLVGVPAASAAGELRPAPTARPSVLPGVQNIVRAGTAPDGRMHHATSGRAPRAATSASAIITVTYHGFSPQAQAAFQAAVDIWEHTISSSVPIHVDATWTSLPAGVLGQAGPTSVWCGVPGGLDANTCYPAALANALSHTDLNGSQAEISASFSSSFSAWYYGTDGNTPLDRWDLETVVLHELGHGLGFISSVTGVDGYDAGGNPVDTGRGYWGESGYSLVFDRFMQDASGQPLVDYPSGSFALGAVLRSGNLFWGGPAGEAASAGSRPRLYAPAIWQDGSSGSHLDEATYPSGTLNALMTPILNNGESIHDPGPIVRGIFRDIGWPATPAAAPIGPGDYFVPLAPARIARVWLSAGRDVTLSLLGRGGVPSSGVDAVVANVEVDHPTATGYLRVTPGGNISRTAVQEFTAGHPISNLVTVRLGSGGTVRLHLSAGQAWVYLDVAGYYQPAFLPGGAAYHPINTTRVYGLGAPLLSAAEGYRQISVLGHGGTPSSGVSAIVANVEINGPTASGYLRVEPAGQRSATAAQEYQRGQTISGAITVKLGSGGSIWVKLSRGKARIYLDVLGWYGASGDRSGYAFHPVDTARSYGFGAPVLSSSYDRDIAIAGTASVPLNGAVAVVANVETSRPGGTGYLRVTPGGQVSATATQHYHPGGEVADLAIVKLNGGMIKLHLSRGSAWVFVDVSGYFA